jgi:hypothetical protein
VSPLKIKTPVKNLGRQRSAEGYNFGVKGLKRIVKYLRIKRRGQNKKKRTEKISYNV